MTAKSINDIVQSVERIAEDIREYSRSQKDLWRQVPYLALQADGRNGYSSQYQGAYEDGYWVVRGTMSGPCYQVLVDLESGELVDLSEVERDQTKDTRPRRAKTKDVLKIAFRMEELDAGMILEELKRDAKSSSCPIGSTRKEQAAWRAKTMRKQGLRKSYTRKHKHGRRISWFDD